MTTSDITVTKLAIAPVEHDPFVSEAGLELDATPSQRAMWDRAQQSPEDSCVYNETFSIKLKGEVNEDVLVSALQTLPVLHACVRAQFSSDGRRMFIRPKLDCTVTRHNLSSLSPSERDARLADLTGACARTPYDLEHGPLFRASVITVSAHQSMVLLGAHHIVCDGWSLDVLLDDLGKIYSGMVGTGQFPNPARPTVVDFEAFCATDDCRERQTRALGYWKKQMQSAPHAGALSVEGPPAAGTSFPVRCGAHTVSTEYLASAKAFAKRNGLSLFTVQFAAFATLLYRRTTVPDLVICVPVARHPEAEMENTVGNFVHLVPVRCRFDADTSFLALCKLAHTQLLDARENAAVGVDEITSALDLEEEAQSALASVARFVPIHKYSEAELRFGNVSVEYESVPRQFDGYELSLSIMQRPDSFEVLASAHAGNHNAQWLESCLREFEALMVNGCDRPEAPISGIGFQRVERLSGAPIVRHNRDLPKADVEAKLVEILTTGLSVRSIGLQEDYRLIARFADASPSLAKEIGEVFSIEIGAKDLEDCGTLAKLAELAWDREAELSNVVVALNPPTGKPVLFFVFGLAIYGPLARNLRGAFDCYGILVKEESLFVETHDERGGLTMEKLAAAYVAALRSHTPHGPYVIAGLSFGGILAFEVARQLQRSGEVVSQLVLIDAILPGAKQRNWATRSRMILDRVKSEGVGYVVQRLKAKVRRDQPQESDRERKNEEFLAVTRGRATTQFLEGNPRYDGKTLILRAMDRSSDEGYAFAYDLCWSSRLSGPATYVGVPGSHLSLLKMSETAQQIRDAMPGSRT